MLRNFRLQVKTFCAPAIHQQFDPQTLQTTLPHKHPPQAIFPSEVVMFGLQSLHHNLASPGLLSRMDPVVLGVPEEQPSILASLPEFKRLTQYQDSLLSTLLKQMRLVVLQVQMQLLSVLFPCVPHLLQDRYRHLPSRQKRRAMRWIRRTTVDKQLLAPHYILLEGIPMLPMVLVLTKTLTLESTFSTTHDISSTQAILKHLSASSHQHHI